MKTIIRGKEIDTASLRNIRVEAADVDLAALSGFALLELCRCFVSNAAKCKRAKFNRVKKVVRGTVEQIRDQLGAEAERRTHSESSTAAAPLVLVFTGVEAAGYLAALLTGLYEVYLQARSKIPQQGEFERGILDLKSAGRECAEFCRAVSAAIHVHEVEI